MLKQERLSRQESLFYYQHAGGVPEEGTLDVCKTKKDAKGVWK
jgi:hypothetical protein